MSAPEKERERSSTADASGQRTKRKRPPSATTPLLSAKHALTQRTEEKLKADSDVYRSVSRADERLELIQRRKNAEYRERVASSRAASLHMYRLYVVGRAETSGDAKRWRIQIFGKILDRADAAQRTKQVFSSLFREVHIAVQNLRTRGSYQVVWRRTADNLSIDGIEFFRPASAGEDLSIKVVFFPHSSVDTVLLSDKLAAFSGSRLEKRRDVVMGIWQHIKDNHLQCEQRPAFVRMDPVLRAFIPEAIVRSNPNLLSTPQMKISHLHDLIKPHMSPATHEVTCELVYDSNTANVQKCFDITVETEDDAYLDSARAAGLTEGTPAFQKKIAQDLRAKQQHALEELAVRCRRKQFFDAYCGDPRGILQHFFISQTRDLGTVAGSAGRMPGEERLSSLYQKRWVREAIPLYLSRKSADSPERDPRRQPRDPLNLSAWS